MYDERDVEKNHIRVRMKDLLFNNFEKLNEAIFLLTMKNKWPKGIPLTKFWTGREYVNELKSKFVRLKYKY